MVISNFYCIMNVVLYKANEPDIKYLNIEEKMKVVKSSLIAIFLLLIVNCVAAKNPVYVIQTNYGDIKVELTRDATPKTVENFDKLVKKNFYNGLYFHRVIPNFMIQGGCPNTRNDNRSDDGSGNPGYKFEDECYKQTKEKFYKGKIKTDAEAIKVYQKLLIPYMNRTNKDEADKEIFNICESVREQRSLNPIKSKSFDYYYKKLDVKPLKKQGDLIAPISYGTICMANSGPNTNGSQFFIVTKKDGCSWLNGKHTVFGKVIAGMDVVHTIENLPKDGRDNPLKEKQATIEKVYKK